MTGRVGVPGPGERKCGRCGGNGQLNIRVPQSCAAPSGYKACDACDSTGVVPASKGRPKFAMLLDSGALVALPAKISSRVSARRLVAAHRAYRQHCLDAMAQDWEGGQVHVIPRRCVALVRVISK